jgi:hypothetical protein
MSKEGVYGITGFHDHCHRCKLTTPRSKFPFFDSGHYKNLRRVTSVALRDDFNPTLICTGVLNGPDILCDLLHVIRHSGNIITHNSENERMLRLILILIRKY